MLKSSPEKFRRNVGRGCDIWRDIWDFFCCAGKLPALPGDGLNAVFSGLASAEFALLSRFCAAGGARDYNIGFADTLVLPMLPLLCQMQSRGDWSIVHTDRFTYLSPCFHNDVSSQMKSLLTWYI